MAALPTPTRKNFGGWVLAALVVYLLAKGRLMHYIHLASGTAATTTAATAAATSANPNIMAMPSTSASSAYSFPSMSSLGANL